MSDRTRFSIGACSPFDDVRGEHLEGPRGVATRPLWPSAASSDTERVHRFSRPTGCGVRVPRTLIGQRHNSRRDRQGVRASWTASCAAVHIATMTSERKKIIVTPTSCPRTGPGVRSRGVER